MWFWLKQKYESVNRGSVISTRTHPLTQSASNTARLFMSSLTPIPNVLGQAWSRRLGIRSQGLHSGLCLTHWLCFQSPHSPSFGRKSNIIPPCSSPLGCERAKWNDKQGHVSNTYRVLWYPHCFNSHDTGKSSHSEHALNTLDSLPHPAAPWKWAHWEDLAQSQESFLSYRNHLALQSQPKQWGFEKWGRMGSGMPLFTPANLGTMETFFIFFLESSPTLLSLVRIFSSWVTTFTWGAVWFSGKHWG